MRGDKLARHSRDNSNWVQGGGGRRQRVVGAEGLVVLALVPHV